MSDSHKKILNKVQKDLCENMNPAPVLISLTSMLILDRFDVDEIRANGHATKRAQVVNIINTLQEKPDAAFQCLIDALDQTEQRHVANVIRQELKKQSILEF